LPLAVTSNPFRLVFEATVGSGWQGDIAIDDVTVQTGQACLSSGDNGGTSANLHRTQAMFFKPFTNFNE